jgi:glycosyltransferase involved in cell wall biosynthesis
MQPRPPYLDGKLVVFSAAFFYRRKGIPLLVEAFASVAEKHPAAVLRIAGDGEDRPAIEAAIKRHAMASRVLLLGALPHARVLQEMAWADAFALLGWNEPFGCVFAEAAASAKAIVVASDSGFAETMVDGVHGLTVAPGDVTSAAHQLDRVLGDAQLRLQLGRNARALWESQLSWRRAASEASALLRSVAAHGRPGFHARGSCHG